MIDLFKVNMHSDVADMLKTTINSGSITQGKKVEEFEQLLQKYLNVDYVLTVNSATSGLTLAYKLLDLKDDELVLSTPLTCFATNAAILANDLDIVWCDTDVNTCNIDLDDVKAKLTMKTRALSFVHWGGTPINYDKLQDIKKYAYEKFGNILNIIEDCAHAFGSTYKNKKIGSFGNISVFSFQAIKHLTTGDGGCIVLPNKEMYERAKLLRWFGIDREKRSKPSTDFRLENDIVEYGYKWHMNDINATIGIANITKIDEILDKCVKSAEYLSTSLKHLKGLELFDINEHSRPSYWIFTLKVLDGRKNDFIKFMKDSDIVVSQVHQRNDTHSCLSKYRSTLVNLDIIEKQIISIPCGWWLTKENLQYIINTIKEFFNECYISKLHRKDMQMYKALITEFNGFTKFNDDNTINIDNVYALKIGTKVISIASLYIDYKYGDPIGRIEDVVVTKKYRRQGYGIQIVEYLTKIAIDKYMCYKVLLNSDDSNVKFYENCGFNVYGKAMESTAAIPQLE